MRVRGTAKPRRTFDEVLMELSQTKQRNRELETCIIKLRAELHELKQAQSPTPLKVYVEQK